MVAYTRLHFTHEEELFRQTGYPEAAEHKAEHDNTVAWVEEMRRRFLDGGAPGPSLEVVNFLKDWLFDHILGSDQKYVPHLHAAGLE